MVNGLKELSDVDVVVCFFAGFEGVVYFLVFASELCYVAGDSMRVLSFDDYSSH